MNLGYLAKLAAAVADDNVDSDAILAEFLLVALLGFIDEGLVEFVSNEVDGTTTETTAHDT